MENNLEMIVDSILEKLAVGYQKAHDEWMADKRNAFKDGRFLAYYEAKESILKFVEQELSVAGIIEELTRRFDAAKAEWKADKVNPFKDGRLLGYFELLKIGPAV